MNNQFQQAPVILRNRLYQPDDNKKAEKKILVLKTGIAGMQFYIENEEEQKALKELKPGDELFLYREADNKHDKWAIAVYRTEDDKIGHITRFKNETIARLMDAGKKFTAEIIDPKDAELKGDSSKANRQAPTENMYIPFAVYLVEEE